MESRAVLEYSRESKRAALAEPLALWHEAVVAERNSTSDPRARTQIAATSSYWEPRFYGNSSHNASRVGIMVWGRTAARISVPTALRTSPRHSGVCGLRGRYGAGYSSIHDPIWPNQSNGARPCVASLPAWLFTLSAMRTKRSQCRALTPTQNAFGSRCDRIGSIDLSLPNMPGSLRAAVAKSGRTHVQARLAHDTGSLGIIAGLISWGEARVEVRARHIGAASVNTAGLYLLEYLPHGRLAQRKQANERGDCAWISERRGSWL